MKLKLKFLVILLSSFVTIFVLVLWSQILINSINLLYMQNTKPIDKVPGIKYVLQWTSPERQPFAYMKRGQETFIKRKCSRNNCYITGNRYLLKDITEFDAILFHGPEIILDKTIFPKKRTPDQSYFFVSKESSTNYPVPDGRFNGIFNFTWTYKFDSDIYYGYIIIKDQDGQIIGPGVAIPWINTDDMMPVNNITKTKLANKKVAAAWFVSNCNAQTSPRKEFANRLIQNLKEHGMSVDVYGKCGTKKCPRESMAQCLRMIQRDYYFYFAFENSLCEDYVTEKLLHALQNYAVPVVFGGADYNRFMPDGIYLSYELGVTRLAQQIVEIINDKDRYNNFFKWHKHYSYHNPEESSTTDPYCQFCEFLNEVGLQHRSSTIEDFENWWNPHGPTGLNIK